MKRRWALMSGEKIINVVEQFSQPSIPGDWVELSCAVGPGDVLFQGAFYRADSAELEQARAANNNEGS